MGLGAGFKLKDKEREKLKDKDSYQDKESERLQPLSRHSEQSRDGDEERALKRSRHRSLIRHHSSYRRSHEDISSTNSEHQGAHHQPFGWTYMLESWYCNGSPFFYPGSAASTYTAVGGRETSHLDAGPAVLTHKARSTGELDARLDALQKGPYEMLIKERMMGLYLAIFVHRDVKALVESTFC
jgi:hypothetical protein